jgi:hypothetical protein
MHDKRSLKHVRKCRLHHTLHIVLTPFERFEHLSI